MVELETKHTARDPAARVIHRFPFLWITPPEVQTTFLMVFKSLRVFWPWVLHELLLAGISSHPSSLKYPLKSYGSIKAPGSTSDDFLRDVQNSYGTPKDLRKPSTVGYYRTAGGSWARIPYVRGSSGYKYKYITTQQMPIMERDPLLLDLVEDEADFYDGLNEGRLRDPNCENKRHCDEGDLSTNEYRDIAENVQLTRRPKSSFTNAMFKKLMRNAVRQEGRRGQGQRRPRRGKGKRRRCGTRPKRCRKY